MPFCGMCAASAIECPRAWSPSSHTSQKTRCMRHPRLSVAARGGAYVPFCGMCATSGYRMPACLEPLIAHIAKDAMYAPPLIFGSSRGWRIHAVFWHVCGLGYREFVPEAVGG